MPTTPGFHPDFDFSHYPSDLIRPIRQMAKSFYVTRSFLPIHIGNSSYYAILMRPTDEFSIYINTDREIVALFANYDTFEIRTLEAFDDVYEVLESKRVDKSVRFLVCGDHRVENIIRHYLDQNPEYPIIIPSTIDGLTHSKNDYLLDSIRRNYIIRDLFGYQNPLREETFFFGRQDIVNHVLDLARSGQSSSIFGLRKSGKTSAIYAIRRRAKSFGATAVLIDCQNPAVHGRSYAKLLEYVLGQVRLAVGVGGKAPSMPDDIAEASEAFSQEMRSLLGNARSNVLLIFDEIENVSPHTAASDNWRNGNDPIYFWQIIRSFIQSELKNNLCVCIVGTSPHILEAAKINGIDNPIYLFAQKRFLPSLRHAETQEMVQKLGYFMGLDFPAERVSELHTHFGGHPFFIRQVCSLIHRQAPMNRPFEVSKASLSEGIQAFSGQMETYIRDILENLRTNYPEEFNLLRSITRGDKDEVNEYAEEAPDLIDHLIGYELVKRTSEGAELKFDAINEILPRFFPDENDGHEKRWVEIVTRRNAIENTVRQEIYYWSNGLTTPEWDKFLETSLTNKRLDGLQTREPLTLFSSKDSPLFLSDLIMFLRKGNALDKKNDQRSLTLHHLDSINKLRRDAHARKVSDEELATVRKSFEYLEVTFPTL